MDEFTKNKLKWKIEAAGGEKDFVNILENTIAREEAGATKNKKEYFGVEILIIIFSMLSSMAAAASALDFSVWKSGIAEATGICLNIAAIIFPAAVTALVAYRGLKKSYETWLRHRKYTLELNLLINEYLYGSNDFRHLKGKKAYNQFVDRVQDLYQNSKKDFLENMNR